jgi:hypothetical protein
MPSKTWTRESIVFAIRRWREEYGDPPYSKDWANRRTRPAGYPSTDTVRSVFGSWNDGLIAAGYPPRSRGVAGHMDPEWTIERFARRQHA